MALTDLPLVELSLYPSRIARGLGQLRSTRSLTAINRGTETEFWR